MSNSPDLGGATLALPPDYTSSGGEGWGRKLFNIVFGPWLGVKPAAYLLLASTLFCPLALIALYIVNRRAWHTFELLDVFLTVGSIFILFAILGVFSQVGTGSLLVRLGAWLLAMLALLLAFAGNMGALDDVKGYAHLWPSFAVGGLLACLAFPLATLPAFRRLFGAPPASGNVDGIAAALTVSVTMMSLVPLVVLAHGGFDMILFLSPQ